jgi:site-specific recombinase XerD
VKQSQTKTQRQWNLASVALTDAYTDFMLSRQAMNCTPATLAFYRYTAGAFLSWVEGQGVSDPREITARHVRQYLSQLIANKRKDTTLHANARAIRTLLRFWHAEGYTAAPVTFDMPKLSKKRLLVLTVRELGQIVKSCDARDKAIILFFVDSGLRRAEVIALNWGDVDMQTGLVRVKQGKGRKDRSAVIGATTRRALLAYRRTRADRDGALFQTKHGSRFTGNGLMMFFRRLSARTGIHVTAHALRRTFVILSLRNGMDVLHLQALLGHAGLAMVQHYAQMDDTDLLQAARAYGVVDRGL